MSQANSLNAQKLKSMGLKATLPRLEVLAVFESSPNKHLTAEQVFFELNATKSGVGLATIYRILIQFVDAGILGRSSFDTNKAVFELNHGHHHDHMVCIRCGKVVEFFDEAIEARQKEVAKKHKFRLLDHTMSMYGVCSAPECQDKSAT